MKRCAKCGSNEFGSRNGKCPICDSIVWINDNHFKTCPVCHNKFSGSICPWCHGRKELALLAAATFPWQNNRQKLLARRAYFAMIQNYEKISLLIMVADLFDNLEELKPKCSLCGVPCNSLYPGDLCEDCFEEANY